MCRIPMTSVSHIPGASHRRWHHPEWMVEDELPSNAEGYAEMTREMKAELKNLGL